MLFISSRTFRPISRTNNDIGIRIARERASKNRMRENKKRKMKFDVYTLKIFGRATIQHRLPCAPGQKTGGKNVNTD